MKRNGNYEITGPGTEGRFSPDYGSAVSLATTLAAKPDAPAGTWYVRDGSATIVAHVEKHDDRSITIRGRDRLAAPARRKPLAEEVAL